MSKVKGGRKRPFTVLEVRRRAWDQLSEENKRTTKRPGSLNRKKQA